MLAVNEATLKHVRRNLKGLNRLQTGDESSQKNIDDYQVLVREKKLMVTPSGSDMFFLTETIPTNYFEFKSIRVTASCKKCSGSKRMKVYLVEEGNVNFYYDNEDQAPNFDFATTFCTLFNNQFRIYVKDFTIESADLVYYKKPNLVLIESQINPYLKNETIITEDSELEFLDDINHLIVDEATSILAKNIGQYSTMQISDQSNQLNT